jgi:hypothetical protein
LPGFIAFLSAIHQQRQAFGHGAKLFEQGTTGWRIVFIAPRESDNYGRSSICGNQMNLGIPSPAGLPDGLWAVFLMPQWHLDVPSPKSSPDCRSPASETNRSHALKPHLGLLRLIL